MEFLDRLAAEILAPLAVWVLASGLDDLFLDFAYFSLWLRTRGQPDREDCSGKLDSGGSGQAAVAEPGIAILVPCWQEAEVIEDMLDANLAAIGYENYDVWLGVYPNDSATIERVMAAEQRFARIRHVVCPHDGPTTKADCLNAIYNGICAHESASGRSYGILLQHDAEDMIHPGSLAAVQAACERFDMVQVPVFPLRTSLHWLTHGVYCDEFAEYHLKELLVRAGLNGFIPSAGVGTAYRREALDKLCEANGGEPFATDSLTEDYVTGLELRRLHCSQTLLHAWRPIANTAKRGRQAIIRGSQELVATRAYFPFGLRAAIRQRARWLTGNALQSWARFGWNAGPGQRYWLWRDRKALFGAPASALANLLFLYGLARWLLTRGALGWDFQDWLAGHPLLAAILAANLAILVWRQCVRAVCSLRVYGLAHACATPLRAPWGNFINVCALTRALAMYARSRALGQPLAWAKTVHAYPRQESLTGDKRLFGRLLVWMEPLAWVKPRLPQIEMRVLLPRWFVICSRLSVTVEYRRTFR